MREETIVTATEVILFEIQLPSYMGAVKLIEGLLPVYT